ncbi:MAG: hypothetical protein V4714_13075 [Bacteroidota bacterium]
MAQPPNSTPLLKGAQSLLADSLLTQQQYQMLVKWISQDSLRTYGEMMLVASTIVNKDFIQTIIQEYNAKQPPNKRFPGPKGYGTMKLPEFEYSSILKENTQRLLRAGAISNDIAEQLHHQIQQDRLKIPAQLLEYVGWASLFEDWLWPDKLRAYADMLRDQKIISSTSYESLLSDMQAKRIQSGRQLLSYCEKVLVMQSPESVVTPLDFYRSIYEQIRQSVPELPFTDFQLKELREPDPFRKNGHFISLYVSYQLAGQEYKSLAYQYSDERPWMAEDKHLPVNKRLFWQLDLRFYQFINQSLIDHHSEYRIHSVDRSDLPFSPFQYSSSSFAEFKIEDESKASFLLLTKSQADAIRIIQEEGPLGPYLPLSYERYNALTTAEKEQAWQELEVQGFLTGLTPLELTTTLVDDVLDLLRISLHGVYNIEYGEIDVYMHKPYRQLTQELSEYSRGAFKPSLIKDGYQEKLKEGEMFSYGFTFKGKKYATQLKKQANRVDSHFLKFINQALADANVDGLYYDVGNEQMRELIFLTNRQKEYLLQKQIMVKDY